MSDAPTRINTNDWRRAFLTAEGLDPTVRCVGWVAHAYASKDGSNVFPGEVRLARSSGVSERTVRRALEKLREAGWLLRVEHTNYRRNGTRLADVYALSVPVGYKPTKSKREKASAGPPAGTFRGERMTTAGDLSGWLEPAPF